MSRHRVIPAITKRVAAAQPLECQPAALQGSVFSDRFGGILRATRSKAAMVSKEGTQCHLVGPDQKLEQFSHGFV